MSFRTSLKDIDQSPMTPVSAFKYLRKSFSHNFRDSVSDFKSALIEGDRTCEDLRKVPNLTFQSSTYVLHICVNLTLWCINYYYSLHKGPRWLYSAHV